MIGTPFLKVTDKLNQLIAIDKSLQTPEKLDLIEQSITHYINEFKRGEKEANHVSALNAMYLMMEEIKPDAIIADKISCKKGCAYCCHINVDMTKVEGDLIKVYCEEKNIEINYEMLELQKKLTINERSASVNSACVFLDDNNTCKIYDVRPMACRNYMVVNDPDKCDMKKYPGGNVAIYGNLDREIIASAIMNVDNTWGNMSEMLLIKSE